MSNDEFLLNWLLNTIVKPFCAYTQEDLDALQKDLRIAWIICGILLVIFIVCLIARFVTKTYEGEYVAGCMSLLFGIFGVGLLLGNCFHQSLYLKRTELYN